MRIHSPTLALLVLLVAPAAVTATTPTLRGSPASMLRQNDVAQRSNYTFLRSAEQVHRFAEEGRLMPVEGNADYELARVSHPYARPELRLFIERLAAQYRGACGERLVVTSLTRPIGEQPRNAHPLSVHPAGMAVDLRISRSAGCRGWLEDALLGLEARGLLDVTRERNPPHYHVAVFPDAYSAYAAERLAGERLEQARRDSADAALRVAAAARLRAATQQRAAVAVPGPERGGALIPALMAGLLLLAPWGVRALRREARSISGE